MIESLPIAVAVFDAGAGLVSWNGAFAELWRLEAAWLAEEPGFADILERLRTRRLLPEQEDFAAYRDRLLGRFRNLSETMDEALHLPDGRTLRVLTSPRPEGGLVWAMEDVSERLAAERALNESRAVLAATVAGLREGLAVFGADGWLKLSNPAFAEMWGDAGEAGRHVNDFLDEMGRRLGGTDWDARKKQLRARLAGRERGHERLELADGRILDMVLEPLPDGANLLGFLDISDSARVERALRERAGAMEAAMRMKSEFLANLSHEVAAPLTTISGFAEILAGRYFGELNRRQGEYADGIHEAAGTLGQLIGHILDLANVEAGILELEADSLDLHHCLAETLGLVRERARKKGLALTFDCPPGIGWISADARRLRQIVLHLLANAIAFTPGGGEVGITARRDGAFVEIAVTDTGVGIPKADIQRMFEGFAKGEPGSPGAGLGLTLVKSFVELHGGEVAVTSRPNRGTTVTCRLPAG